MLKFLLFFMIIFSLSIKEGFTNKFSINLNTTNTPDFEKYYPALDSAKIKKGRHIKHTLAPNNYEIFSQQIEDPSNGSFSSNIKRLAEKEDVKIGDDYFVSPVINDSYLFNTNYGRQFDYKIIQNEDKDRKDLLKKEKDNDKLLVDPDYYFPHPENTSTVLYDKKLNKKMLESKGIKSNIETEIFKGKGIHPLSTKN
mgnify:CR=1 FL=1